MKKFISVFIALIAVSVYSSFAATPAAAQTAVNSFIVNADTASTTKTSPTFSIQIIKDSNAQKFILVINNPSAEKLQLSISATSTPGFRDQISDITYRKRIDMTGAADDYYTITVSNKKQQVSKRFMFQTSDDNNRSISIE